MIREATTLQSQDSSESDFGSLSFYVIFVSLHAVSITQQGFITAMVYSWTHEDMQHIVSFSRSGHRAGSDLEVSVDSTRDGDSGELCASGDEEEEEEEVWEISKSLSASPALSKKTFVGRSHHQTQFHT